MRRLHVVAALLALACPRPVSADQSTCYGRPGQGRLQGGVALPLSGTNYAAHSRLSGVLGRNHLHADAQAVVLDAYATLARDQPSLAFLYGEMGWAGGGRLRPHRTHQSGTSADFMVPLRDAAGRVALLPAHVGNRWGYGLEFDADGQLGERGVDFAAIAAHLRALHQSARAHGLGITQVIFDPPWLPRLFATADGAYLRQHLHFMPRAAWVRHDEHYHVDFAVTCLPLSRWPGQQKTPAR